MRDHYKGYRMPKAVIGFAVKYYLRYKLSLRDISEILLDRGIEISYETIRSWCKTWGPVFARSIRKKRTSCITDKWHVDEVRIKINGKIFWLWRAVDSQGEDIEILLQKKRNAKAAIRLLKNAMRRLGFSPRLMITDKLKSYKKAHKTIMSKTEHRAHKGLNNRAENSHQPTREKERQMRGFKSQGSAQRLLSSLSQINNLLKVGRFKHSAQAYKAKLKEGLAIFNSIVSSCPQSA